MDESRITSAIIIFLVVIYLFKLGASMYKTLSGPQGRFWITAIITGLVTIALVFWYTNEKKNPKKFYVNSKKQDLKKETKPEFYTKDDFSTEEDYPLNSSESDKEEEEDITIKTKEDVILTSDLFAKESLNIMTWDSFKKLVSNEDYHRRFRDSILEASSIKIKRYREIRNDVTTANGEKKRTVHDILNPMNADNVSIGIVQEIDNIISALQKPITAEDVKRRLKNVVKKGESIVGRRNVLDTIAQQLFAFSRNPKIFLNNFQNIVVFGPSGVGKTKLAMTISEMYTMSGILARNNFIKTTKADYTTAYVNESAKITRKVLMRGLEGVIFIDEAYDITPPKDVLNSKDHGGEAITEMVNHLDKFIGLSIVIAGGYEKEMKERFLGANEGMDRRFFHKITLDYYSGDELFSLCKLFLKQNGISLTQESGSYLWGCIENIYNERPEMFDKQASDMLSLAGKIGHVTYSNLSGELESNHRAIISEAIAQFTEAKGEIIRPQV